MDFNGISALAVFGKFGSILAFMVIVGRGLWVVWAEVKEQNRLRQEREEARKKDHQEQMNLLHNTMDKISERLSDNDDRTDFAESLGLYAHERLDAHLGEQQLPILKKARRPSKRGNGE